MARPTLATDSRDSIPGYADASTGKAAAAAWVGRRAQVLATVLVCLGIAAYGLVTACLMPLSARMHYDPSLQYMLSSLAWFRGASYSYVDHPGTPVEVLGTVMLALSYPLTASAPSGFITFQLSHAQFLSEVQTLLVVASMLVCVVIALRSIEVSHWTQALVGTAIAGLFFAVLPGAFESLALWSHESFCYPAGALLSLAVQVVVRRTARPSWRVVASLGFAAGVLSSIQLYFAAWIVGTALALSIAARLSGSTWRCGGQRALLALAAAAAGFVVATLPIHDHYRPMAGWIVLLLTHQGNYGGGPSGFSSPDLLTRNLDALVADAPVLFITSATAIVLLAARLWPSWGRPSLQPAIWATGVGFTVQLLALLVLVGKHPGVRYLLPVAATLPVLFATALDGLDAQDRCPPATGRLQPRGAGGLRRQPVRVDCLPHPRRGPASQR